MLPAGSISQVELRAITNVELERNGFARLSLNVGDRLFER